MARPKSDSREKILASAHRLLCRQGYRGTGLAQIVEEADAPRGSVYYLFPGGKEEIAVEAVRLAAANSVRMIEATRGLAHPTARAWVAAMADHFSRHLMETGFSEGLPITTVTLDSVPGSDALAAACKDAYRTLVASLADTLEHYGIAPGDARGLAMLLLGALEGSMVLARAEQSLTPCELILERILPLFPDQSASALPGPGAGPN